VKITWENPTEEFVGLVVYKGRSENDLRPISGTLKETFYLDKAIEKGTSYYQVRTYDDHGHKHLSKVLKVHVK
jgi:hypothetical protein